MHAYYLIYSLGEHTLCLNKCGPDSLWCDQHRPHGLEIDRKQISQYDQVQTRTVLNQRNGPLWGSIHTATVSAKLSRRCFIPAHLYMYMVWRGLGYFEPRWGPVAVASHSCAAVCVRLPLFSVTIARRGHFPVDGRNVMPIQLCVAPPSDVKTVGVVRWLGFDAVQRKPCIDLVSRALQHPNVTQLDGMLFQFVSPSTGIEQGSFLPDILGAVCLHVWPYTVVAVGYLHR